MSRGITYLCEFSLISQDKYMCLYLQIQAFRHTKDRRNRPSRFWAFEGSLGSWYQEGRTDLREFSFISQHKYMCLYLQIQAFRHTKDRRNRPSRFWAFEGSLGSWYQEGRTDLRE